MQAAGSNKENADVLSAGAVDDSMEAAPEDEDAPEEEARVSTPLKRKKAADGGKVIWLHFWNPSKVPALHANRKDVICQLLQDQGPVDSISTALLSVSCKDTMAAA